MHPWFRPEEVLRVALIAGLLLLPALCEARAAEASALSCGGKGQRFARTELMFGLSRPEGPITEAEFQLFIDAEVTPRFPAGSTLLAGSGRFRDARGRQIAEASQLLILLYPADDRRADRRIEQIRALYKRRFGQESVLRADQLSCVRN